MHVNFVTDASISFQLSKKKNMFEHPIPIQSNVEKKIDAIFQLETPVKNKEIYLSVYTMC